MAAADYRIMTDATGQRIATALEAQSIDKAAKADLTSIIATGTTNTTGATITAGTYFYLNGTLVQAKANIASGATFTSGTNYEAVTAGGFNDLKNSIASINITVNNIGSHTDDDTASVNVDSNTAFQARRYGSLVVLSFDGVTFATSGNNLIYANIPAKYRTNSGKNAIVSVGGGRNFYLMSVIGSNIIVYNAASEQTKTIYGSIVYSID